MARDIQDVQNVDVPTAAYPNGKMRDKAGVTSGTILGEPLHGDHVQFFSKLMRDASPVVIPNSLPDNETNGYQLFQAFINYVRNVLVATETAKGTVEKATVAEGRNGTADKFVDATVMQSVLDGIALGSNPTSGATTLTITNNNCRDYYSVKKAQFSGNIAYSNSILPVDSLICNLPSSAFNPAPSEDIYGLLFIQIGGGSNAWTTLKVKLTTSREIRSLEASPSPIAGTNPFHINLVY